MGQATIEIQVPADYAAPMMYTADTNSGGTSGMAETNLYTFYWDNGFTNSGWWGTDSVYGPMKEADPEELSNGAVNINGLFAAWEQELHSMDFYAANAEIFGFTNEVYAHGGDNCIAVGS